MRIYIGGLGSSVQEGDLKKTFTSPQLGNVESVEIFRTKGRSFGYLEFIPASEKGLAKLFSTYNGCMWKGGRLKLEKAREDYLSRLQREWEEEAELKIKSSSQDADEGESVTALAKPQKHQDLEKMQLKIFFPKLRKIKPVPLRGTGKHKYSFQRVEIPPLPIHFCDCEEHSGPPPAKRNLSDDCEAGGQETHIYEVNENELNMMKTILDKLLEKKHSSGKDPNKAFVEETNNSAMAANNNQVDDEMEDGVSDEDDLLINVTGQSSKGGAAFEDWVQETTSAKNEGSFLRESKSSSGPVGEIHEDKKERLLAGKKRRLSNQNNADETVPSGRKARKRAQHGTGDDLVAALTQPTETESGSVELSHDVVSSRKSTWKDLVRAKGSSAFHISDILAVHNPEAEAKPRSDIPAVASNVSEKEEKDDLSNDNKESENVPDVLSAEPSTSRDKIARGAAWLQKSSWLQLVSDANSNAFIIEQVLPGGTFEKLELRQNGNKHSNSSEGEQHKVVNADQRSPTGNIVEPHGRVNEDAQGTQANPNVNDLMERNSTTLDEEPSKSDPYQTVEKNNPLHSTNNPPNYRAVGDVVISETCPFMRTAASMKEWTKTKAALSGSLKKKGKGKAPVQD